MGIAGHDDSVTSSSVTTGPRAGDLVRIIYAERKSLLSHRVRCIDLVTLKAQIDGFSLRWFPLADMEPA